MNNSFSNPDNTVSRRQIIGLVGICAVAPLAGCAGDDNDDEDELPLLSDVLQWETGYVMVHGGGPITGTVTVYDGDFHSMLEYEDGPATELYRIGSDLYIVSEGECIRTTDQAGGGMPDFENTRNEFGDTRASDRTTISNEEVYIFEVNGFTFQVSVETGYPVLITDPDTGISMGFHSWSETEPISPPDIECIPAGDNDIQPPTEDVPGEDLADVPRFPDSVRTYYSGSDWAFRIIDYLTEASLDEIVDFYETQLPDHGWTLNYSEPYWNDEWEIDAEKDGAWLRIEITPSWTYRGYHEIWIQYAPPPPTEE